MTQLKETKSRILVADEVKSSRWVIHEKMKAHAQKVKTHVKKHHKKYLGGFFAGFAIAKTIKVVIAAVGILVSFNHGFVDTWAAENEYDGCTYDAQFCINWYIELENRGTMSNDQLEAFWTDCVGYASDMLADYNTINGFDILNEHIINSVSYGDNIKLAQENFPIEDLWMYFEKQRSCDCCVGGETDYCCYIKYKKCNDNTDSNPLCEDLRLQCQNNDCSQGENCEDSWNEGQFLNADFWERWYALGGFEGEEQGNRFLVSALFGEGSAYSKWWEENDCRDKFQDKLDQAIVLVSDVNDISAHSNMANNIYNLYDYTIYVLDEKELNMDGLISMGTCSAIVSPNETQIYIPGSKCIDFGFYMSVGDFDILDNVGLSRYAVDDPDLQSSCTSRGINVAGNFNTVNDVQVHGFFDGLYVAGQNVLLNNIQSYGNSGDGISVIKSISNVAINNTQTYRNGRAGIYLGSYVDSVALSNIQTYSNRYGIYADTGYLPSFAGVFVNGVMMYDNNDYDFFDGAEGSYFYFVGDDSYLNCEYDKAQLSNFDVSSYANKNYESTNEKMKKIGNMSAAYVYSDTGCLGYDYITNPYKNFEILDQSDENYNGNELYNWYDYPAYAMDSSVKMSDTIQDNYWSRIVGYSYGSEINGQKNPIVWLTGGTLGYVGSYNSCKYIGSTTTRVTDGYIKDENSGVFSISQGGFDLTADSSTLSTIVLGEPKYVFYGDIDVSYVQNILAFQSIIIYDPTRFVTQLFGSNIELDSYGYLGNDYFATHFEESKMPDGSNPDLTPIDCGDLDWDNEKFLDEDFWEGMSEQTQINRNAAIKCALYGSGPDDMTAYTKGWSGWRWGVDCDIANMNVREGSTLPINLTENTIYILQNDNVRSNIISMPNCTAIVGDAMYCGPECIISRNSAMLSSVSFDGTNWSILDRLATNGSGGIDGGRGVYLGGDNNTLNNIKTYNYRSTNFGSLNGCGILISNDNNVLNNIQTYGNTYGIAIDVSLKNVINNAQIYNNKYGIFEADDNHFNVYNNIYVYNNDTGITLWGSITDFRFNNLYVYNNVQGFSRVSPTNQLVGNFYGDLVLFSNSSGNVLPSDIETGSAIISLGWSAGQYSGWSNVLLWNYITNPRNYSSNYLLPWTGNVAALRGTQNYSGTTMDYSYGINMGTQQQPVAWSGNNLIKIGNYKTGYYIGSNVSRVDGYLEIVETDPFNINSPYQSTWVNENPVVLASTSNSELKLAQVQGGNIGTQLCQYDAFIVTGYANSGNINKYSLFNIMGGQSYLSNNIGSSVTVSNICGNSKNLVTQLYSTNNGYFASHFQGTNTGTNTNNPSQTLSCDGLDWNNDYFLTGRFWTLDGGHPTDDHIKCALYGASGGDTTAYTKYWSGWVWGAVNHEASGCDVENMDVVWTTTLSGSLEYNTIYVVTGKSVEVQYDNPIAGNGADCVAIVSNTGTILYSTNKITDGFYDGMISFADGVYSNIIDNFSINGAQNSGGGNHNINNAGIKFSEGGYYLTINNVSVYGNKTGISIVDGIHNFVLNNIRSYNNNNGIYIENSKSGFVNNVNVYNNSGGICMSGGTNNTFNNIQVYNNSANGFDLKRGDFNSFNNAQIYNNGGYGVLSYSPYSLYNNVLVYNNSGGIKFYSVNGLEGRDSWLKNVKIYNNKGRGLDASLVQETYITGTLQIFGNDDDTIASNVRVGYYNGIQYGNFENEGILSWDLMMNPKSSNGQYLLSWTGDFVSLRGYRGNIGEVSEYSYGSEILAQAQPVAYDGSQLVNIGNANSTQYIGGTTRKAVGTASRLSCTFHSQSNKYICDYVSNWNPTTYDFLGTYRVYVLDAVSASDIQTRGLQSTASGYGINDMNYVTQLQPNGNTLDMATHFENDGEMPIVSLSVTTGEAQTTQTATLRCSDTGGVVAYYWGTTEPTTGSDINVTSNLSSITSANGGNQTISSAGSYWLACKDAAGNWDKTGVVIRSYKVQNLLDTLTGTATTYTKPNYATNGSVQGTYLIPNGTPIRLDSGGIYGDPIGGHDTYKGWKTAYNNTNNSTPDPNNPTLTSSSTVTYYRWYTRDTHTLTLNRGNGVSGVSGGGIYKHGKSVSISATMSDGYCFHEWIGDTSTVGDTSSSSTTVTMDSDIVLTGVATDCGKPSCTWGAPSLTCISGGMAGYVQVRCTDDGGINTTSILNTNVIYDSVLSLGNGILDTQHSDGNMRLYNFTYTGIAGQNGSTTFTLNTGAVLDTNNNGNDLAGPSQPVEVDNQGPNKPTNLDVVDNENRKPTFTWDAVANDNGCSTVAGYQIQVCSNNTCGTVTQSETPTSTSWTATSNLTAGTTYYWRVRAKDALGNWGNWNTGTVKVVSLTFNATTNGGTTTTTSPIYRLSGTPITLSTGDYPASKAGWEFVGWNTSNGATNALSDITPTSNKTVYAIFKKDVTVTFNVNGNQGSDNTDTCTIWNTNTTCTVMCPSITPAVGFTTIGWSTASTIHTADACNVGQSSPAVSSNKTYYAQSKNDPITYTATYKRNTKSTTGIVAGSGSCTIDSTYNGASQATSCNITLGNIFCNTASGYTTPKWNGTYNPLETSVSLTSNTTFTGACSDTEKPVCEIIVTTNDEKSTSQTATLSGRDGVGIVGYYWGTSSSPSASAYTTITSTTVMNIEKTVSAAGTYYLFCKDAAGNTSTSVNKAYNSYSVQNMLDKINGTATTYNETNYDTNGSLQGTYIIVRGTALTLDSGGLYGDPIGGHDTYKGWSITDSTTIPTTNNQSIAGNVTYYRWYNRKYYDLDLIAGTGTSVIKLPTGYTRVEYVQSQGSGYIDTEYVLSNHSSVEVQAKVVANYDSGTQHLFGNSVDSNSSVLYNVRNSNSISSKFGNQTKVHPKLYTPNIAIYKINSGGLWVDDQLKTGWSAAIPEFQTSGGFYLFTSKTVNGPSVSHTLSGTKIYRVKVEEAGELAFYGVPCRTSTGVYGIYDVVGNKFHPSEGTIDLTGGADMREGSGSYKYGESAGILAKTNPGYTWSGWTVNSGNTPVDVTAMLTTVTITGYTKLTAVAEDITAPTVSIEVTTGEAQTGQMRTLKCSDGVGVTKYYWKRNIEPTETQITGTNSLSKLTSQLGWTGTLTASGTYWLACRDAAGNWASTGITISSYQVKNMLDKLTGNAETYDTTNYAVDSTKPTTSTYYLIPSGTTLILSGLCTEPSIPSTLKMTSVGNPGTSSASGVATANASDTTYACRYARDSYDLDLIAGTGTSVIKLPTGYTRVEYVQSQGSGYIDTEYVLTNHSSIEAKAVVVINSTPQHLLGNKVSSNKMVVLPATNSTRAYFGLWTDTVSIPGSSSSSSRVYKFNELGIWRDGEIQKDLSNEDVGEFETSGSFYLFASRGSNGPSNLAFPGTRIYRVKVEEAGELAFYGVPCRTSTGVYGIYDVVGNKFHPSEGMIDLTGGAEMREGSGSYKYGESAGILAKTNPGYTWSGWTVNYGNTPVDITLQATTVTLTENTRLTAVAEDITAPRLLFTGATPASDVWQNWNYFTKEIQITEGNMSVFTGSLDSSGMSLYDDSLVLMYNFDNVSVLGESDSLVKDLSKYGNDGTISSPSSVIHTDNGRWGGAYRFNGGNINAGNATSLRATKNFTVSAWINTNNNSSSENIYVISRWQSSKRVWGLIIPQSTSKIGFYGSVNGAYTSSLSMTSSATVVDGNWHFITLTHNGSQITLYVDGVVQGSKANTGLYDTDTKFVISSSSSFSGFIDEVRMYDRALTADEVSVLYRSNLSKISTNKWLYTIDYTGVADGQHTYGGEVVDVVGQSTGISRTINIDTVAPVCTINVNPMGCTSGNVTLSGIVTEVNNSGYSWTGWSNMKSTLTTFVLTGNGNKTLYLEDRAGNTGSCSTGINNIDRSGPTGTINISGGVIINGTKYFSGLSLTLLLSGLDSGCSTVEKMRFSCDGTSWSSLVNYASTTGFTIPTSSYGCNRNDGAKTIYVLFIDALGNTGIASTGFVLDRTSPTITVVPNTTGCTNSDVQHQISYNDTGAGINTSSLVVSSDNMSTWGNVSGTPSATTYIATWTTGRNSVVYRKICDKVGNCATTGGISIKIDKTAPTVTVTNAIGNESTWITGSVSASDNSGYCGTLTYYWTGDVGSGNTTASYGTLQDEPTTKTAYVRVTDAAGNSTVKPVTFTWKNISPVNVSITNNGSTGECKPITFIATGVDTGTVLSYQWYTGANCTKPIAGATGISYTYTLGSVGTYSLYVKVSDSQGSGVCSTVNTATWVDESLSAHNFTGHSNVGNTERTVNWLTLSEAKAGSCETIKADVVVNGNIGKCTLTGTNLTYLTYKPEEGVYGDDRCELKVMDGDSAVPVIVTWKNIDTELPKCVWGEPIPYCISGGMAGTIDLKCSDSVGISQTSVSATNVSYNTTWLTLGNSNTVAGTSASKTYTFTYTGRAGVNGTTGFTLKANAVKDTSNNGNVAVGPSVAIEVDNSAPDVPKMNLISPSCDSGTSITVSSTTKSDVGCAGDVEYQFCMMSGVNATAKCGSNSSSWSSTASVTFNNLSNGTTYYFFVRARDGLGNTSSWSSSVSYTVDITAPTTTAEISPTNWSCTSGNVTVSFSAGTNGCNSDNTTYYCTGANNCTLNKTGNSVTFSANIGEIVTGYVRFRSVDGLGNAEHIISTGMIYVDKAGPKGLINVGQTCYTGTVIPLKLKAEDIGCSTVSGMRFSCDGVNWSNLEDCGLSISSSNTKAVPVKMVMWYDKKAGKIYYYTDADKIYLNEDSAGMFAGYDFTTIDLSAFDTSRVMDMSRMFEGCSSLNTIYAGSGFTTGSVKESIGMFKGAEKLVGGAGTKYDNNNVDYKYAHIDGGKGNPGYFTEKVSKQSKLSATLMTGGAINSLLNNILGGENAVGFEKSDALPEKCDPKEWTICGTKISDNNLSNTSVIVWYDKKAGKIYYYTDADDIYLNENSAGMFAGLPFASIDLSNFDTSNVVVMTSMFEGCSNLNTIYVGDRFTTEKVKESTNMFLKSESLMGGAGTVYSSKYVDVKRAHIDGGKENPGYFTEKANNDEKVATMVSGKEFNQTLGKLLKGLSKADPVSLEFDRAGELPSSCQGGREPFSESKNLDLMNIGCDTTDGDITLYVQYIDALGNEGIPVSTSLTLDQTAPYITLFSTDATCKTGGRARTVRGTWNENVVGFDLSDISVINGTRGNNFIISNNPAYSWAVTSPTTGYGTSTVTLGANIVTDSCGNPNTTSTGLTWQYDNVGPTFTVDDVSVVECNTGTLTINGVTQIGCAAAHTNAYSRNGGSSYGNSLTFSQYNGTTGTQTKTIRVRDNLLNYTETTATITWTDAVLSASNFVGHEKVGNEAKTANWKTGSEASAGSCETISATLKTNGGKGSCVVVGDDITYTPNNNKTGSDTCVIEVTDGDTIKDVTVTWNDIDTVAPKCGTWSYAPTSCTTGNVTGTLANSTDQGWGIDVGGGTCSITSNGGTCSVTISDLAGNTTVCTSSEVTNIDRTAPNVTVTNVTGVECSRITGSVSATDPTPKCGSLTYSWNGGSYGNKTSYGLNQDGTGSQSITVRVKDSAGNVTTETVIYTRTDAVLSINSTYDLGLLTGAKTINNVASASVFNATGYGSCETVTITSGTCINATMSLNGGNVTITPNTNVSGTGSCTLGFTDGDTVHTGTINFTIQTLQPTVVFTGNVTNQVNPSGSCINRNRYLAKMEISNTPELGDFVYAFKETVNGSTNSKNYSVYDSGLVLMYNFDNVASLGDTSTLVKDLSNNGNDGTIASATWTTDGVWGGAYNFVDGNINAGHGTGLTVTGNMTVSAWIKTNNTNTSAGNTYVVSRRDTTNNNNKRVWGLLIKKNTKTIQFLGSTTGGAANVSIDSDVNVVDKQWHHIAFTHDGSQIKLYVDGVLQGTGANTGLFSTNANLVIAQYISTKFNGQVDEVRMYNRALSQDEIQFLYKSNLSKINTGTWLFQTLNTCLAQSGTYAYSGIVTSRYGQLQTTGRKISTCIPTVVMTGGVNMNLGTGIAQNTSQVFTGQYTVEIRVEDWIGRNGWTGSVRISDNFSGQNKHFMFSSTGFRMKYDSIQYLGHYMTGIIPEYTAGVKLSDALSSFSNIVKYNENNQGTPYFVANYPEGDFMCNGGVYGDRPFMQLEVPAGVPVDTYKANIYFTIED